MKKLMLLLLCLLLAAPALAGAEVYYIEGESGLPADWAERDTLRMTVVTPTAPMRSSCSAAGRP